MKGAVKRRSLAGALFAVATLVAVGAARPPATARAFGDDAPRKATFAPPVVALVAHPDRIDLAGPHAYTQLLVSGRTAEGELLDVTRRARVVESPAHLDVDERGLVRPTSDGEGELVLAVDDLLVRLPYHVSGAALQDTPRFLADVMPILARSGCSSGACHGSADGQKGFKLSLRGYDPRFDHASLTDDLAARRFDRVEPERSLFLLKPTAAVPHEGGQRVAPGSHDYEVLRAWVEGAARFDDGPRVAAIRVLPEPRSMPEPGMSQQIAVLATFTDGSERDVTAHAFVETSDIEVVEVDDRGLVTALRRGEAAILARYDGHYASTRLFVMGDRAGYEWVDVPEHNFIDTLVDAKLQAIRARPSELCTDAEFARRVHLDLTGLPPTAREVRLFLRDARDSRTKREELIDRLIGNAAYVDHWTNKWCDLLQVNPKFLGDEGARRFRVWIEDAVVSNRPYDAFAREVLSASGSTHEQPPASYYKVLREPDVVMENTTQLFLGVRFNCNKCHDHPFERWTQADHWQLAAFFAQVRRENVPGSPDLSEGVAQEERVSDATEGEVRYPERDVIAPAEFPFTHAGAMPEEGSRRARLTAWVTAAENPYFARSFVNRTWSYFLGVGIIDPVDDIRASNPPSNPELLDRLTNEFVESGFDVRALMRTILRSRVYQQSVGVNEWNDDDDENFSHALARRLPAEVLYDAVHRAAGARSALPGLRPGTRAARLIDPRVRTADGFLELFGRPPRQSSCECERSTGMSLGQALNLVNGPTLAEAIRAEGGGIEELVQYERDPRAVVEELYLSFLSRFPTEEELVALVPTLDPRDPTNLAALAPSDADALARRRAEWEATLLPLPQWDALRPVSAVSAAGTELAIQADGRVVSSGPMPDQDAYTVVLAVPGAAPLTALRLEVLADGALPGGGPGRAENGNFVLTDLAVQVVPRAAGAAREVAFGAVSADFSQEGWPVAAAVDGVPSSGWAVMPRFGADHEAIFELTEDVSGDALLVLTLAQHHGSRHTLGTFRVSATSAPRPVRHHGLPADVVHALVTPRAARTPADERRLHERFLDAHPELGERVRLAAAQDLAWALANSPAFLFNR